MPYAMATFVALPWHCYETAIAVLGAHRAVALTLALTLAPLVLHPRVWGQST